MRTRTRTSVLLSALLLLTAVSGAVPTVGAAGAGTAGSGVGSGGAAGAADAAPSASVQSAATCEFPVTVTDATGTEVTVEAPPERVTTLNPSAAQTMWEIGGRSQVVGVSRFASYLDGAASKENVSGRSGGTSVEAVVGTEPDLVLAPNAIPDETVASLRDAGLTVAKMEMATSAEDVREKTTLIGRLTGNCEGAAEANAWMMQNVGAARNATANADRPRAFYALGGGYTAGEGTFIDSMITAAGGTNVVAEANVGGYPQLNDERVVELAPEVVVVTAPGAVDFSQEPWASTPAAENGSTVRVDPNYLNQPAPRSVVYAVRNLTEGFHPDVYERTEFVTRAQVSGNASGDGAANGSAATDSAANGTNATGSATATGDDGTTAAAGTGTTGDGSTSSTSPGFGVGVAAVALLASGLLALRRD